MLGGHPGRQPPELDELRERLEHQVRVDRRGAVADEDRDAVHAPRLARLDDDPRLEASSLADEVVVHGPGREQGGDRHAIGAGASVGEDDDVRARGERDARLVAHTVDRALEAVGLLSHRPGGVDRPRLECGGVDHPQLLELAVEQDRVVDHELPGVLRRLVEQIALRADARTHAHHERLADRVDRRIGHLREQLLEVRVEKRLTARERGERRVVTHRADRFLRVPRKRREDRLHVLLCIAEEQLAGAQRLGGRRGRRRGGQLGEPQLLLLDPGAVGLSGRDDALRLLVRDDPSLREVDEEELAGL